MRYYLIVTLTIFTLFSTCLFGDDDMTAKILDIPSRFQWENGHGYCGETSVQSIGLYYGAWLSQDLVRKAGDGEFLLDVNDETVLRKLHFNFETWREKKAELQKNKESIYYDDFMVWMKQNIVHGYPVIFSAYLYPGDDVDYDHIMPAIGIVSKSLDDTGFNKRDRLIFSTLFDDRPVVRSFRNLGQTRQSCRTSLDDGGCIPTEQDQINGDAVLGFIDKNHVSLPIRLTVDKKDEANVSKGHQPEILHGRITVFGLQPEGLYTLLRYDGYETVPEDGDYFISAYSQRMDFKAETDTWIYDDSFLSNGSVYYRCIKVSD